mmetsp:Transcript_16830/g.34663  ORF Transcript_16830/g.34663 Transcript_16830/m.34663 type:complete len:319 (-) Transcript_16830:33-989(-)
MSMSNVSLNEDESYEKVMKPSSPPLPPPSHDPPPVPDTPGLSLLSHSDFMTACLSVGRADALIQTLQMEWREIVLIEMCACTIFLLVWFSDADGYISFLFHLPHFVRCVLGYKISLFLFPDLLKRMDQTLVSSASSNFGEFFKNAVKEFQEEIVRNHDNNFNQSAAFTRKNMLFAWVAFSGFCLFFDICALLTTMFTVYGAEDGICLVMACAFFFIDIKIICLVQQPTLYSTGEKVFTWASIRDAMFGQRGLFETENFDVTGTMGSPVVGFQDGDVEAGNSKSSTYNMEPVNLNSDILEGGNMGMIDTRPNKPLERRG